MPSPVKSPRKTKSDTSKKNISILKKSTPQKIIKSDSLSKDIKVTDSPSRMKTPQKKKYTDSPRTPKNSQVKDLPKIESTPYHFRERVKKQMHTSSDEYSSSEEEYFEDSGDDKDFKSLTNSDSSKSSSEEEISDGTANNSDEEIVIKTKPICTTRKQNSKGKLKQLEIKLSASKIDSDKYFSSVSNRHTSNNTLNQLKNPRLAPDVLHSILKKSKLSHEQERAEMFEDLQNDFSKWNIYLLEGYNIFLCGIGSKKELLLEYQKTYLSSCNSLVINGFFPSLTLKSIMVSIFQDILCMDSYPISLNDQIRYLCKHYNSPNADKLYLIVNNIDGTMLRPSKVQHTLSQLASCKHVHLLASVDHVNNAVLFDGNKRSSYKQLWFDCTTFQSYSEEISHENSLLIQQSGDLAFSSLIHVFKSLTPNAKEIFKIIGTYHLDHMDSHIYSGIPFSELYKMCRENFLVNSDLTLKAQLTEFKDHKLIRSRKGIDGAENITVCVNASTLKEFLDQLDDF